MIDALILSALISITPMKSELHCLASVVHHEARGETEAGQIQVASVVMNRAKSKHYPDSLCKVAFQKAQFSGLKRIKFSQESLNVAAKVFLKQVKPVYMNTMYYHTISINPNWSKWDKIKKVGVIGNHKFYIRKKNG